MMSGGRWYTPVLKKRVCVTKGPVVQLEGVGRFDDLMGAQKLALDAILTVVVPVPIGVIVSLVAARAMIVAPGGEVEPRG